MSCLSSGVQRLVGEDRHVLRAGLHGLVDVLRARRPQGGAYLPFGQRAALAGEVVALGAVGAEELATLATVVGAVARVVLLLGRDGRAGAERGDVRRELVDLRLRVRRRLLRDLGARLLGRHPAGADLEVDRGGADADQRRAGHVAVAVAAALAFSRGSWRSRRRRASCPPRSCEGLGGCPRPRLSGANAAYAPTWPPARGGGRRPPADGWRRRAEQDTRQDRSTVESRALGPLLDHVDRGEEADPDDIDEVPVVGHDDGAVACSWVNSSAAYVRPRTQQEGDETARHVQAVEAGGQVEHRAVRVGREREALVLTSSVYSKTWPPMKIAPITNVTMNHSACPSRDVRDRAVRPPRRARRRTRRAGR